MSKDSTLYAGSFEINSSKDEMYHFANGYIDIEQGHVKAYCYYVKDHLGNVRHVDMANPRTNRNEVVQVNNYYPFGGIIDEGSRRGADVQNHLYNGKELDRMHGLNLYDYSARQYDAAIGQFTSMDPLCEKYYHISPYAYCAGNPVKYVDPDGEEPTLAEAAAIADHVYNAKMVGALPGGWQRIELTSKELNSLRLESHNDNGFKSAIYGRWDAEQGKYTEYVYATAGTDFTSKKDWENNIAQLDGNSEQYRQSVGNAKALHDYFGDKELTFVGHSLGGGMASANSLATGRNAITFNAAGLSKETKTTLKLNNKTGTIKAVVAKGEILDLLQKRIGMSAEGTRINLPTSKWSLLSPAGASLYMHTMGYVKSCFE